MEIVNQKTVTNPQSTQTPTEIAYAKLIQQLDGYGNRPSPRQKQALRSLLDTYTNMAFSALRGRIAFPLPPGLGKTTSIVCWMWAVHELGFDDITVAVAASKVEQLCELKRNLVRLGVPPGKIGLKHSYSFSQESRDNHLAGREDLPCNHASEPSTPNKKDPLPNDERQFLLVTHQRVQSRNGTEEYMTFKDGNRSLLVWDESLMASDCRTISHMDLESNLGWVRPRMKFSQKLEESGPLLTAFSYCEKAFETLNEQLKRQELGRPPQMVNFPKLTEEEISEYRKALRMVHQHNTTELRSPTGIRLLAPCSSICILWG